MARSRYYGGKKTTGWANSRRRKSRSKPRRSYAKKRSTFRPRKMSRRSILNVTSRKKQDNMLSWSNKNNAGNNQAVATGGLYVNGLAGYSMCVFCPTARSLTTASATNLLVDQADRTSTTCFMRGYKENLRIQTSSPLPWLWRRIVFATKGPTFYVSSAADTPTIKFTPYSDTSVGMARLWFDLQYNSSPATVKAMNTIIFKGNQDQDWNDVITAKVDPSRITVMSDRTCAIKTTNSNGHFSERKLWYPMNKNLVYDDDEAGAAVASSYYSTDAKPGMGDVYVVDYVVPGVGGATSDIINFNATATLYWHEK
ncbi:capsid protein [Bark beetle-associated genomovirus 4]|uniref:Capsid protein n=1 Tax=Bark beetle-associated genomovirus 4 TaxID=2230899 RepID=A0A344A3Q2_9VIRU|nr:capsid protein [Bark beetle-associated genomovirus 4]AWU66517.1 capsid protein [Bark beetle-associated genomovirus 4]